MPTIKVDVFVGDECCYCNYLVSEKESGKFPFSIFNTPYCNLFKKGLYARLQDYKADIIKCEECVKCCEEEENANNKV